MTVLKTSARFKSELGLLNLLTYLSLTACQDWYSRDKDKQRSSDNADVHLQAKQQQQQQQKSSPHMWCETRSRPFGVLTSLMFNLLRVSKALTFLQDKCRSDLRMKWFKV